TNLPLSPRIRIPLKYTQWRSTEIEHTEYEEIDVATATRSGGEGDESEDEEDEQESGDENVVEEDMEEVDKPVEKGNKSAEGPISDSGSEALKSEKVESELKEEDDQGEIDVEEKQKSDAPTMSQTIVSSDIGNSEPGIKFDLENPLPVASKVVIDCNPKRMTGDGKKQIGENEKVIEHVCKVVDEMSKPISEVQNKEPYAHAHKVLDLHSSNCNFALFVHLQLRFL
ncbi:hypothetical protein U1Q18_000780, partial [Sarracenia purpurea var. burkii]